MLLLLLALIFVPVIASAFAQKNYSGHLWAITGASFGVIVYPFLSATTIPLIYGGGLGNAILSITNQFTILHRLPGKVLYQLTSGHALRDDASILFFALSAVIWGVVYGFIGRYIDRNSKGE